MKKFDFDNHFNKVHARSESIFKFAFATWVVCVLVTLVAIAAGLYVAAHFLAKFW